MLEILFGKKEIIAKKFTPTIKDIDDYLSDAVSRANKGCYTEFCNQLLYWAGLKDVPDAKFESEVKGTEVDVSLLTDGSKKLIFAVGLGEEKGIFFDNRTLLPGYEVFKLKPYSEIRNQDEVGWAVWKFIKDEPKPDEIIDIRLETFKQKMVERQSDTGVKKPFSRDESPKRHVIKK